MEPSKPGGGQPHLTGVRDAASEEQKRRADRKWAAGLCVTNWNGDDLMALVADLKKIGYDGRRQDLPGQGTPEPAPAAPPPEPLGTEKHEGAKYLRAIRSATQRRVIIKVDVYAVLEAFAVTCPARAHCVKKLLCAGQRGKGSCLDDLASAQAALARAVELERERAEGA